MALTLCRSRHSTFTHNEKMTQQQFSDLTLFEGLPDEGKSTIFLGIFNEKMKSYTERGFDEFLTAGIKGEIAGKKF